MRGLVAALAGVLVFGEAQAASKAVPRPDAPTSLESAAARDEAQAQAARQQAQAIEAERQAASAAAAYAAGLRAREESRARAAGAAAQRALAGIGAKGADAQSASARAALAAQANATRRKAQGAAGTIAQSEAAFKARETDIAALILSLEEEADAFAARAIAQRALAAKERERQAAAARAKRFAQAAKRTPPVASHTIARTRAAPAPQAFPKFAAAPVLIEGGGQVARVFGAQQAGGPKSTGILLAPQRLGAQIAAPISGKVLHAGPLRHLGMVLIMDAGNGYVLVFGGLEEVPLKTGAQISRGDRIGHLPRTAESALYFEVRHNGISIDPASWSMLRS